MSVLKKYRSGGYRLYAPFDRVFLRYGRFCTAGQDLNRINGVSEIWICHDKNVQTVNISADIDFREIRRETGEMEGGCSNNAQ